MPQVITNAITWLPHRFSLKWAEGPDDVPPWDYTRGIEPHELWPKKHIEMLAKAENKELDEFIKTLRWDEEYFREKHHIRDAPETKGAYPRLVCAEPVELGFASIPEMMICEAIARLAKHLKQPVKFKEEVLSVASTYSLSKLEGFRSFHLTDSETQPPQYHGETLLWWAKQAKRMRYFLELKSILDEDRREQEGGYRDYFDDALKAACEAVPHHMRYNYYLDLSPAGYRISTHWNRASPSVDEVGSPQEAMTMLSKFFQRRFEECATLKLRDERLYTSQGWWVWAYHELAMVFSGSGELVRCKNERCDSLFFKRQKDQDYCDPKGKTTCKRMASYYRKKPETSLTDGVSP